MTTFDDFILLICNSRNFCPKFFLSWVMPRRVVDLFACWWKAGRSRSAVVLKTWRIPWRVLLLRFFLCCIFGRRLFCHPCLLVSLIFLFVFLYLLRCFLVYTSSVLRCFFACYKMSFTYQKKKKRLILHCW